MESVPKPTDPQTLEKVRALLASGVGVNEVARQVGMSSAGVSGLKKRLEQDKSFEQERADKKQEFIELAWQAAAKGIRIVNAKLDDIEKSQELAAKTDMREISTAVGTMIDKARLAAGESTQNVNGTVSLLRFEDF